MKSELSKVVVYSLAASAVTAGAAWVWRQIIYPGTQADHAVLLGSRQRIKINYPGRR
jgi:hypothetical protein